MVKDLTVGKPSKIIVQYSIPMLLSMVFQQLYNIGDSIIAGKMLGESALAATGASYPITMIFVAIGAGAGSGIAVIIANLFGQKRYKDLKTASATSLIALFVLGGILTLAGVLLSSPLISALNTPSEIFTDSVEYLKIYIYGVIFMLIYNGANSIFNGMGDSMLPLGLLIFSSVSNIILDLILAKPFGVKGLAYATLIAQGTAGCLAFILLIFRLRKVGDKEKFKLFNFRLLGNISKVAVPSILQQSFVSIGMLGVQSLINSMGVATVAGYSAAIKINSFCIACLGTMSGAVSSYTAQNISVGAYDRVRKGYISSNVIMGIVCIIFTTFALTLNKFLLGLFMDTSASAEAFQIGTRFLTIVSPCYIIVAFKLNSDGVMRGAGAMKAFMLSTFVDLTLRVAFSFILVPIIGFDGICASYPIGWGISAAIAIGFYLSKKWQKKAILA